MATNVKWFSSEMAGAPVVSGTKGSLLSMIDACLVTGFGLKTASSVSVASGIATVTLATGNFFQHQVILIAGATPSALNGEKRVLALPTATTFTFDATGVADGAASGTITVKTAPLGWLKAFAGTNSGAYKIDPALHPDSTTCLVRISDTGNYNAQICGYESMSGIDTGAAAFPTAAQQALWVFRSNATDATARTWFIVGDSRCVYVGIHAASASATQYGADWFGFGEFKSKKTADPFRFTVTGNAASDANATGTAANSLASTANTAYGWLARAYTGLGAAVKLATQTWPSAYGASGAGPLPYPNSPDYGLLLCKAQIFEASPVCYRGDWPGMYFIPQACANQICPDTKTAYLDTAVPGFEGKVVGFFAADYSTTNWSPVAFDLTGPWEH